MAPAYKLTYFDFTGPAEPIRWLFVYGGLDFEDTRIKHEDWPNLKPETPFGQLPLLEHNGETINQSVAIARYVAKQVNLVGKDDWENLKIDAIVDTLSDFKQKASVYRETDEAKRKELVANLLKDTVPFYLQKLEAQAKKNNGYLALNGKLTWADFIFAAGYNMFTAVFGSDVYDNTPNLKAVKERVTSIPAIKDWIEKHPAPKFP